MKALLFPPSSLAPLPHGRYKKVTKGWMVWYENMSDEEVRLWGIALDAVQEVEDVLF